MSEYKRPLPIPDEASQPFFDGAKRHELMLQKCNSCGSILWPVKTRCDVCLTPDIGWTKASGKGTLYTYVLMHQIYHPGFADEVPYNISVIELEEGIRMTTNIVGCPNSELRIGMPVEATFEQINDEVTIPKFKPAG